RQRSYALGKLSGKASVLKNIEELGISLSEENLKKVLQEVVKLGDSKETVTADDLPFIIADVLESSDYQHIKLLDCNVSSSLDLESVVSLKIELEGQVHKATGSGNGGYDAFTQALQSILDRIDFTLPELIDYSVRIPRGGKPGALTECTITWTGEPRDLRARGVHANQVFAAVLATLRMVNTRLHSRQGQDAPAAAQGRSA